MLNFMLLVSFHKHLIQRDSDVGFQNGIKDYILLELKPRLGKLNTELLSLQL